MTLVKCVCLMCNKIHEWDLSEKSFYPKDFEGDKRVVMNRTPDAECKAGGQFVYESKIEHAPAS